MNLSELQELYTHMEWADASVWQAVLRTEAAAGDQKIRDYFYHLHLVQRRWLEAWRGEPFAKPYPTFDDAKSLYDWGRSYYREIFAYLDGLSDAAIAETMQPPWAEVVRKELGREPASITIGQTMLQVSLHSLYHRGQINARLREVGGEPPRVDYIIWLWLDQPAASWDL